MKSEIYVRADMSILQTDTCIYTYLCTVAAIKKRPKENLKKKLIN